MLSKIVSCLVTIVSVSALNEPACFRMGRTIIAKNLGDFGCAHIEGQYDRAYEIEDGKLIIRDIEMGGEILLELYGPSGPMILPGDECCVPTEFVVMLECVKVLPDGMGDCHRDLQTNEVVITNLPQTSNWFHTNMISCVHDIVNYGIYTPDVNGDLTFEMTPADLLLNTQVELYATNGEECCMCYIMSLDCPIKEQEPEGCQSCLTDSDCPNSPTLFGETATGQPMDSESLCGSYCNDGECSNVQQTPDTCDGKSWNCGQSLSMCGNGFGSYKCYCTETLDN